MEELFDICDEFGKDLGRTETRDTAHANGLWHKAVVCFILNNKNEVLLQKRHPSKKLWPNMWGISCGGHVSSGETYEEAAVKEAYEELGVKIPMEELIFIGEAKSEVTKGAVNDKMHNKYFVTNLDISEADLQLQETEVTDAKFISIDELKKMVRDYSDLTPIVAFDYLINYMEGK